MIKLYLNIGLDVLSDLYKLNGRAGLSVVLSFIKNEIVLTADLSWRRQNAADMTRQ